MSLNSFEKQIADQGQVSNRKLHGFLTPQIKKQMPTASKVEIEAEVSASIARIREYWKNIPKHYIR